MSVRVSPFPVLCLSPSEELVHSQKERDVAGHLVLLLHEHLLAICLACDDIHPHAEGCIDREIRLFSETQGSLNFPFPDFEVARALGFTGEPKLNGGSRVPCGFRG